MGNTYYAGIGGAGGGPGTTWATRYDLPSSMIAGAGHVCGDRLVVGPGVYRENVVLNAPGGAYTYAVGTIDVTNESTAITGNGTNWLAGPVLAGDMLFVGNFETQADGACPGGALTLTSALGTPEAGMVGYMVEIMGRDPYLIASVTPPNTFTLSDPNAVGNPAAGAGLTYYIPSGEGPYEIAGDIAAGTLTLVKPWSGPDLTTIPYIIYRPIYLIGDVSGAETDGVGGQVRITGGDANDELRARAEGISGTSRDYWLIRGFQIDCCSNYGINMDTCNYITIEDCVVHDCQNRCIRLDDCMQVTIRRCIITGAYHGGAGIYVLATGPVDNGQYLIENCYVDTTNSLIVIERRGSVTIKNLSTGFCFQDGIDVSLMNVGAGVFVHDSVLTNQCSVAGTDAALRAAVNGQLISQYNNIFSNARDVSNVTITAQDTQAVSLPTLPLLGDGVRWPMQYFAPSEWEASRAAGGLYPANEDLFGIHNEVAQTRRSWGAQHHYPTKRDASVAYSAFDAAQVEPDAMEQQHYWNVQEDRTYTITAQVYIDAAYTGNNPQMTVSQPGQTDVTATSTGAIGSWEQLTATFTTGSALDWLAVFLKSRNTSALANKSVRWNDLNVRQQYEAVDKRNQT